MAFDSLKAESMMPTTMPHNDELVKKHQINGHMHHSSLYTPHAAGHQYAPDMVKAMCGGGKAKK
jgi:hypothetical protein